MKRFNIVTSKKYTKNGEEKTQWLNVGSLVRFEPTQEKDEGYILELNMFPGTKFSVFEQKPREERQTAPVRTTAESDNEEIDIENIPF